MTRSLPEQCGRPLSKIGENDDLATPVGLAPDVYALEGADRSTIAVNPEDMFWDHMVVAGAFACLDLREQCILSMRLGLSEEDPMTLQALSDDLGVAREQIREIERDALKKIEDMYTGGQTGEPEDMLQISDES